MAAAASVAIVGSAMAADVSFLTGQQPTEWLAGRLVGTDVLNGQGEIIGKVSDVVLNGSGQVQAVVVGVGGFLGVGSKDVGVPFSAIKVGDVLESRRLVVLNVTKDQLKAAPTYKATDPSTADRLKKKASEWAKIAKDKAVELSKQAVDKVQEIRDQMQKPAETTPAPAPAPAPK
jgi:sporulation protein YlmC with PRC-barrel domain